MTTRPAHLADQHNPKCPIRVVIVNDVVIVTISGGQQEMYFAKLP